MLGSTHRVADHAPGLNALSKKRSYSGHRKDTGSDNDLPSAFVLAIVHLSV
jgi:hypothetical protein